MIQKELALKVTDIVRQAGTRMRRSAACRSAQKRDMLILSPI